MHQQSPGPHRRGRMSCETAEPVAAARRTLHAGERASRTVNVHPASDADNASTEPPDS